MSERRLDIQCHDVRVLLSASGMAKLVAAVVVVIVEVVVAGVVAAVIVVVVAVGIFYLLVWLFLCLGLCWWMLCLSFFRVFVVQSEFSLSPSFFMVAGAAIYLSMFLPVSIGVVLTVFACRLLLQGNTFPRLCLPAFLLSLFSRPSLF